VTADSRLRRGSRSSCWLPRRAVSTYKNTHQRPVILNTHPFAPTGPVSRRLAFFDLLAISRAAAKLVSRKSSTLASKPMHVQTCLSGFHCCARANESWPLSLTSILKLQNILFWPVTRVIPLAVQCDPVLCSLACDVCAGQLSITSPLCFDAEHA
jgi:hypothetical protein